MLKRVAVGTDGSATAAEAVKAATEMAQRYEAELVLLGVFQDGGGAAPADDPELQWASSPSARLREILERTEKEVRGSGVECRTLTDEGDPAEALVRLAESCEADVLVIGNKGMHRRVLGKRPQHGHPSRPLLGVRRQDDVAPPRALIHCSRWERPAYRRPCSASSPATSCGQKGRGPVIRRVPPSGRRTKTCQE